jgi:hypothetical protein
LYQRRNGRDDWVSIQLAADAKETSISIRAKSRARQLNDGHPQWTAAGSPEEPIGLGPSFGFGSHPKRFSGTTLTNGAKSDIDQVPEKTQMEIRRKYAAL